MGAPLVLLWTVFQYPSNLMEDICFCVSVTRPLPTFPSHKSITPSCINKTLPFPQVVVELAEIMTLDFHRSFHNDMGSRPSTQTQFFMAAEIENLTETLFTGSQGALRHIISHPTNLRKFPRPGNAYNIYFHYTARVDFTDILIFAFDVTKWSVYVIFWIIMSEIQCK